MHPGMIPALLATQLMAAEVYARFLHVSSEGERELWKKMLEEELEHVEHLRKVLSSGIVPNIAIPEVNAERMRDSCDQVIRMGSDLFLLRLEGALRLECAELDYGLEGLAARRLRVVRTEFDYPGDISKHIGDLLQEAERYAESRNIGMQIRRLQELLETSLTDTVFIPKDDETKILP